MKCLAFIALFLISAISPAADLRPKRFKVQINYFPHYTYTVEKRGETLIYEDYTRRVTKFGQIEHSGRARDKFTPSAADWEEFRRALDELQAWRWKGEYANDEVIVADGITLSVDFAFSDRALASKGDNFFPDKRGVPQAAPKIHFRTLR